MTDPANAIARIRTVLRSRWFLVLTVAVIAALAGWRVKVVHPSAEVAESDLLQLVTAARMWLDGKDPYSAIGPGLEYDPGVRLYYPFTAVLAVLPLSFAPAYWPEVLFVIFSTTVFLWAVSVDARYRFAWVAVVSAPSAFCSHASRQLAPRYGWRILRGGH